MPSSNLEKFLKFGSQIVVFHYFSIFITQFVNLQIRDRLLSSMCENLYCSCLSFFKFSSNFAILIYAVKRVCVFIRLVHKHVYCLPYLCFY